MQHREQILTDIEPETAAASYRTLGLDRWTDVELLQAAAAIISKPKLKVRDSFELHAPLELLARYSLLPLVAPEDRDLARIRIVAAAVTYRSGSPAANDADGLVVAMESPAQLIARLRQAIKDGNVAESDALFMALSTRADPAMLVGSIADLTLRTLTSAAHAHIGLMLIARLGADITVDVLRLARAVVRALATDPLAELAITTGAGRLDELEHAMATVPSVALSAGGIMPIMRATEGAGRINDILGSRFSADTDSGPWEDAVRTSCRVAAAAMLRDNRQHAKYGWSHCLTFPQAAWALARSSSDQALRRQAARSAITWVVGFRSTLGQTQLDTRLVPKRVDISLREALTQDPEIAASVAWHADSKERHQMAAILATEASIGTDAHLCKYTLACFDASRLDAEAAPLYYAAAAYLCALWCGEESRSDIRKHLR